MSTAPHEVLNTFLRDQFRPLNDDTEVVDFNKLPTRELVAVVRDSTVLATVRDAALALAKRVAASKYGSELCVFTDEYNNEFEITYDIVGRYYPQSETDPPEFPDVEVRTVELGGHAIPYKAFSPSFRASVQEFCEEDAR